MQKSWQTRLTKSKPFIRLKVQAKMGTNRSPEIITGNKARDYEAEWL